MTSEKTSKQVLLVIFDGWGYSEETKYNAIHLANPVYFNSLWQKYPHTLLKASGEALGLPEGQIGTSEIAHTTIGVGSVIYTDLVRVNKAIAEGTFIKQPAFIELFDHLKKHASTLHIMGMVSPGGVHSHQDHLFAFIKSAKEAGVTKIVIHAFTDGRDKPPRSADDYIKDLERILEETGVGRIATITGRYYAMDRDTNWDRTQKAYGVIFKGEGRVFSDKKASDVVEGLYQQDKNDEFFLPCVLLNEDGKPDTIQKNDGLFFFNFRPDRARQISHMVTQVADQMNLFFVTLSQYDKNLKCHVAFPPIEIKTTLAEQVSLANLTQAHIAETEKYAHVTYFFNGGRQEPYENEEQILIPTRKDIPTHDLAPEMKAKEIADAAISQIEKGTNFVVLNFANPDMVGHTGNLEATIKAITVTDQQLKRVVEAILSKDGVAVITADHGNAEFEFDEKIHQRHTAHTLNPVPAIVTKENVILNDERALADIAPTILDLLGIDKPAEMTGESLLQK